jgi:serine/threonine-protein kinase
VRFGDSGHEAGHWYILLEYFPSESLKEVLEERRFLPVEEGLNIARQVLSALDYAHQRKLLHRDIKPGNILLDDQGRVKVVDFGLAKRLVDSAFTSQTTTGMPGTPLFMAPELLQGGTATFRADIYSAAATIFRMLTGRHPIEAKKLNEWLQAIQTQVPPPANSIREEIPQQIADALAKALSKNPRDRQTTIAELTTDLGL